MKTLLFTLIALNFTFSYHKILLQHTGTDSNIIAHVLDGNVDEWPASKFELNKETDIKYAIDNDANNLYAAMIIPKFSTQLNLMAAGMELYIDIKGKKREDTGIEFPVKSEGQTPFVANQNGDQKGDKQAIRSSLVMNLLFLKLFGQGNTELIKQSISQEGGVNIGFSWDSTDVMYIEYLIPLSIFSENSLNQKMISIGWKINAPKIPMTVTRTEYKVVAVPAGSLPPVSNNRIIPGNPDQHMDTRYKDQSFWTKYVVMISK